jgi:UDPglucose--hexose-1-phosphate uridylyltransferase
MSGSEPFDSELAASAGYRIDPLSGAPAWMVPARQGRPNLPSEACPFCVGGVEAPEPYDVLAFPNRWPPFENGRAEIVLYTSEHHSSFADLTTDHARRVVDLWAERSATLGARDDVSYVLVFENRGPEVGATIAHPHGQIYAFDIVPPVVATEYATASATPFDAPSVEVMVATHGEWSAWVPPAASWPYELLLAPSTDVPDLPSLNDNERNDLASLLIDCIRRLDALFDEPMPFMMWFHQRPFDDIVRTPLRVHAHIAPLLRSPGTQRFVAAGELGSGVWFNPIEPIVAAAQLRSAK